jgi:hypothetical protein
VLGAVCSCPGARSWSELTLALAPVLASRCCWPRAPGAAAFSGPLPVPGPAARARAMMMTRQGRGPSFTLYAPPSRAASRLLGRAQAPAVDRACALRHSEHAHLLSNIEKLTLPILGSNVPFLDPNRGFGVSQRSGVPARRRVRGPRAPLARATRANTAQHGSEDVDVRSRLRPDALPYRRFVFGHIVVHARIRDNFAIAYRFA